MFQQGNASTNAAFCLYRGAGRPTTFRVHDFLVVVSFLVVVNAGLVRHISNYRTTTTSTPRKKKSKSLAKSIDCVLFDLNN